MTKHKPSQEHTLKDAENIPTSILLVDTPLFAWAISILVIFSTICFVVETLPNLSETAYTFLYFSEICIVTIFIIEYLYRVVKAPNKLKFIFSFYGLVDLIAILPVLFAFVVDLRALRLLRLLSLMRIFKLVRYNRALRRFVQSMDIAKDELILYTILSFIFIFLASVGIYHFENPAQPEVFATIFDCLWWAVITLTTVGYGDMYPITTGGRMFTFVIILIGISLVAVPIGIISSALTEARMRDKK